MNLKRYIDSAVRREVRRVFYKDATTNTNLSRKLNLVVRLFLKNVPYHTDETWRLHEIANNSTGNIEHEGPLTINRNYYEANKLLPTVIKQFKERPHTHNDFVQFMNSVGLFKNELSKGKVLRAPWYRHGIRYDW